MWLFIYIFQELLRVVIPLFIFIFPLPVTIVSMILDTDALVAQKAGLKWRQYHRIDKLMDYWFYIMIVVYSLNKPIAPYILGLFIFRSIGQFLSLKTYRTKYLIFFPQIIDFYFLVYLFSIKLVFLQPLLIGKNNLYLILVLLALGLVKEFWVHVWNFSLADFLKIDSSWGLDKKGASKDKIVKLSWRRKK